MVVDGFAHLMLDDFHDLDEFLPRLLSSLDLSHLPIEGERGLTVHADPDHLQQILINYLANAAAYGGPPIWIELRQEPVSGGAPSTVMRVCDRGPGVPASFVPDLFRSFRRGTASGGGSGLGLAISRQLAHLNGGGTWHEPLDPGAAFAVRLPA